MPALMVIDRLMAEISEPRISTAIPSKNPIETAANASADRFYNLGKPSDNQTCPVPG